MPFCFNAQWLLSSLETQNRDDEELHKLKVPQLETNDSANTPSKDDSIAQHTLNSLLLSPNYDKSFDDVSTIGKSLYSVCRFSILCLNLNSS